MEGVRIMISAVIFDLDGVIVSTDNYHYQAWKKIADEENIYFDEEVNNRLRGVSRSDSLEIILERSERKYTEFEKTRLTEAKNTYYIKLLESLTAEAILPNVKEVLIKLKTNKIKIAIGSSSKNAKLILKQIGLIDLFDAISDGNDIKRSKPHPEVFLIAAKRLGIEPTKCAVIEDASAGIEAAKKARMYAIGIGAAKNSKLCDLSVDNIAEIIEIVKK
jgi:beta-phosphoglucomutase